MMNSKTQVLTLLFFTLVCSGQVLAFDFTCGLYDVSGKLLIQGPNEDTKEGVKSFTLVLHEGSLSEIKIPLIVAEDSSAELQALGRGSFMGAFKIVVTKGGTTPSPSELVSYRSRKNPGQTDYIKFVQSKGCK